MDLFSILIQFFLGVILHLAETSGLINCVPVLLNLASLSAPWSLRRPLQLGQGVLVQVSPSLVKRRKTHFHNLLCGASIILGNNGYVWIYPTPAQQDEEAGGFFTSTEVRPLNPLPAPL